ncbi:hypothetical protein B0H17DRAFT_1138575 [Mycena rosella]|uniref:Uncharacterized protein n=1 Tax=Mycena rosella TaxID=1033263 RepID=A0AAD7D696_MYCRO|nr:hypothetical protein B0H17DRAFT_1138575 [Mycena rosella]
MYWIGEDCITCRRPGGKGLKTNILQVYVSNPGYMWQNTRAGCSGTCYHGNTEDAEHAPICYTSKNNPLEDANRRKKSLIESTMLDVWRTEEAQRGPYCGKRGWKRDEGTREDGGKQRRCCPLAISWFLSITWETACMRGDPPERSFKWTWSNSSVPPAPPASVLRTLQSRP